MFSKEFTARGAIYRLAESDKAIVAGIAVIPFEGWHLWRMGWRQAYKDLADEIRRLRRVVKDGSIGSDARSAAQSRRHYARIAACNMMLLLTQARVRRRSLRSAPAAQ